MREGNSKDFRHVPGGMRGDNPSRLLFVFFLYKVKQINNHNKGRQIVNKSINFLFFKVIYPDSLPTPTLLSAGG